MKDRNIVSAKITPKMKEDMQKILALGYWISESDFIRDAIKNQILIYTQTPQDYASKLENEGKR